MRPLPDTDTNAEEIRNGHTHTRFEMITLQTLPYMVVWCDAGISGQTSVALLTYQIHPVKNDWDEAGAYCWCLMRREEGGKKIGRKRKEGGRGRGRGQRERSGHIDEELQYFLTVSARCLARVHKVRENASSSSSSSSFFWLSHLERGSHDVM